MTPCEDKLFVGAELARDEALPVNISVVCYVAIASKLGSHKSSLPQGAVLFQ